MPTQIRTIEEAKSEFNKNFIEILGLETDPDGTPDMLLIRDDENNVLNGIDLSYEKEILKDFIDIVWKASREEVIKQIEDKVLILCDHCGKLKDGESSVIGTCRNCF